MGALVAGFESVDLGHAKDGKRYRKEARPKKARAIHTAASGSSRHARTTAALSKQARKGGKASTWRRSTR